jgi:hypothetical protein
MESGTLS